MNKWWPEDVYIGQGSSTVLSYVVESPIYICEPSLTRHQLKWSGICCKRVPSFMTVFRDFFLVPVTSKEILSFISIK